MLATEVILISLSPDDRQPLLDLIADFQAAHETRFEHMLVEVQTDFAAYLEKLDRASRGEGLLEGYAPWTDYYLAGPDRELLGLLSLRHKLVPRLMVEGGHIGYTVRPSRRRMGYATLMLSLSLEKARALGLSEVLITCDEDNVASARVIEKNGGVLENQAISPNTGKPILRYWIKLQEV